ncbi:MAG TPA: ABC transporter ATP-binding protein [Gemmatimonadaceae bacterium]|nr:ABC transporter ATP-binding protein [Gemmatimonadaceae bacterium]
MPPRPPKKPLSWPVVWRETRALMWEYRYTLVIGLTLTLVNRLAGFVLPASSKYLIDDVIAKSRTDLLTPIALAAGAATLVQAGTTFAISQVVSLAGQRAITIMRRTVQAKVLRLPVSFFDSTQSGVLISRVMSDAEGIRNLIGTGIVQMLGGLVSASIGIGVLFYLNWQLTTLVILFLAVFGSMMAIAFTKLRPIFRKRSEITAEISGRLGQALGGARVVKAYTAEKREELVFARGVHRLFRNIASSITGVSAIHAVTTVIVGGIGILMMVVGGNAILAGQMTLGDFVLYVFFVGLVSFPLVQMASIGTQLTEAFAGLDRIREILDTPTEDAADASKPPLTGVNGAVTFEDVWFEYRENQPVLKGVSFVAPAGTTTALVGSSGSGKSTLISLVMAFNRPQRGRVLIDGRDLDTMRLRDYRSTLGVVLQDNFLFDGTVAENISFSRPTATRDEILAAARVARCDDFVSGFPEGYETIVGERGVKLSGGQRQRVAIARAVLANPQILILDEATSSLDSESEEQIKAGLAALRAGRTTFVIAHRLSTITSADQILVIEDGRVVERGTHAALLAQSGRYRELYERQYRAALDQFINPGEELPVLEAAEVAK